MFGAQKKQKKNKSFLTNFIIGGAIGSIATLLFSKGTHDENQNLTEEDIRSKIQNIVGQEKTDIVSAVTKEVRNTVNDAPKSLLLKLIEWLEEDNEEGKK